MLIFAQIERAVGLSEGRKKSAVYLSTAPNTEKGLKMK